VWQKGCRGGGGEWYQSKANGLGLRRRAFFFSGISCGLLVCIFPFPLAKSKVKGERKKN